MNPQPLNDKDRARASVMALDKAEGLLDLAYGASVPLAERCQRILMAAMRRPLEPRLYQIVWKLRKAAQTKH